MIYLGLALFFICAAVVILAILLPAAPKDDRW